MVEVSVRQDHPPDLVAEQLAGGDEVADAKGLDALPVVEPRVDQAPAVGVLPGKEEPAKVDIPIRVAVFEDEALAVTRAPVAQGKDQLSKPSRLCSTSFSSGRTSARMA